MLSSLRSVRSPRSPVGSPEKHQRSFTFSSTAAPSAAAAPSVRSQLREPKLFHETALIGGEWKDSSKKISVLDPATGQEIGKVPDFGPAEADEAIRAAHEAFGPWKRTPAKIRSEILQKWAGLMMKHQKDLAYILTREQGKPLAEAEGEIAYGASYLQLFAAQALSLDGDFLKPASSSLRVVVQKDPVGVVGAISPWNFPSAMLARKAGAAIAAGCTMVMKPSELTPFSALSPADLGLQAGLPEGVLSCITTSNSASIGEAFTQNPMVRKISFTGSTRVGKLLLGQSNENVQRSSLELGGNAPFIVFEDADLDLAVESAVSSKFRNAGQTCVCANRILVQDSIHDEFVKRFVEKTKSLTVGPGTDPKTAIGPLINEAAVEKVECHVHDAKEKGAKILLGGSRAELGENSSRQFYQPTVLTEVTEDMVCFQEEVFGPSAPIFKFKTEEDAIRMANDTSMGLAAYFYTSDMSRVFRMSDALQYGMVGANSGSVSLAEAPFGGIKESGIGREGSKYGLDDYLQLKAVHIGGL